MPRLLRLNSKQIIKLLEEAGFELDHVSGSHYIYYHPVNGKRAVVPYHSKTLPIGTLKSILREAGLEA